MMGRRFEVTVVATFTVTLPPEHYVSQGLSEGEVLDDARHAALVAFRRGEYDALDVDVEETTTACRTGLAATALRR